MMFTVCSNSGKLINILHFNKHSAALYARFEISAVFGMSCYIYIHTLTFLMNTYIQNKYKYISNGFLRLLMCKNRLFTGLPLSTPAIWSVIVRSCIVMPRFFAGLPMSGFAFSVYPFVVHLSKLFTTCSGNPAVISPKIFPFPIPISLPSFVQIHPVSE